jgi:murein DD-endopeptidase MepM/ murein hydrolase activator NlpD
LSPTHNYKKYENRLFQRLTIWLKNLRKRVRHSSDTVFRLGKQRFTVMFIPHSEKKIFNFQLSVFMLIFILGLTGVISLGFFLLSTRFSGTSKLLSVQSRNLDEAQASLETLREEIGGLQKIARSFQGTLDDTLKLLGIEVQRRGEGESSRGDLSSFFSLSEVGESQLRELHDVQNLRSFLSNSLGPLKEINGVLSAQKDFLVDIPTLWPVKGVRGRVTNNFGPAEHPFTHQWYLHRGIDIAFGYNVPIVTTANGKVVTVEYEPLGFGNYVLVRHKYGFYTKYAHLNRVNVSRGQELRQGQIIGLMGSTGLSTGPHVHYEVRIGSEVVDPSKYLNISNTVVEDASGERGR